MALLRSFALAVTLALVSSPAWALGQDLSKLPPSNGGGPTTAKAPEIGAAGLGGAAVLLVGGAIFLGSRMRRRRGDKS
jgi:hypothetical protein